MYTIMQTPSMPENEEERLSILRELLILDTPPEERFDVITRFCTTRFGVSMALVSLVDSKRQWFKSACGLDAKETSREVSFCGHTILENQIMLVSNALEDARFADNPLVTGAPYIRFYAGAPLRVRGHNIGTLCLIDDKPQIFDERDQRTFWELALLVTEELQKPYAGVINV